VKLFISDMEAENLDLHIANVHCKRVMLAGSTDRGYVTALRPFTVGSEAAEKLELVEAVPFPLDFKDLATRFRIISFPSLFRNTSKLEPIGNLSTPDQATYATAALSSPGVAFIERITLPSSARHPDTRPIRYNRAGQRLDESQPRWDQGLVKKLEKRGLCLRHFLSRCDISPCHESHQGELDDGQRRALKRLERLSVCQNGTNCQDINCVKGHSCAYDGYCGFGANCKFGREMHGIDQVTYVNR